MKEILRCTRDLVVLLAGLFLPFYIGGEVLPDGWLDEAPLWWSGPMFVLLFIFGVGMIASAHYTFLGRRIG